MTDGAAAAGAWPPLPLEGWRDTYATLHMWTQVVGKVCIAATTLANHWWNIAFRVGSRGLTTPLLRAGDRVFTMEFDFVAHRLLIRCEDGSSETVALEPRTVADFYAATMAALTRLGIAVRIWTMPVEVPEPIRFELDTTHRSYDPAAANAFFRALVSITPVLERFRCRFVGKCSPVHFFWGSFDLAVTRFSGRRAPARPGADAITREAYSHEVISHGFWPGGGAVAEPVFYAYAAPEPDGFRTAAIRPAAASYQADLGEFILPYDAVRASARPDETLTAFVQSTYDEAARLAQWDRAALER
jgi:Family of unknown function (DUF5996)